MSPILAAWLLTGGTTVIGIVMAPLLMRSVRSPALPRGLDRDNLLKFAEGERDRIQAVAKGLATTSSVFLVALVTALVDDSISKRASPTGLVCLLLGAVGMLFIAAAQSKASAHYMAAAVVSYSSGIAKDSARGWPK